MQRSKKTKILFILPSLMPGGAERILITLMNNIDRNKFEPEFLALNEEGPIKDWIVNDIPFHSFGKSSVKASLFKLISLVRKTQPDVIFTTMVHCNALALLMKFFFPHIRVVVREAALPSSILSGYGFKGRLCKLIYKFLYPKADVVISNCSQVLNEFKNDIKLKTDNHTVLFNPVDVENIFSKLPDKFTPIKGRENTAYFVCVGRLSFEKGYDRLIRALKDFKPDFASSWRLDIIGEGAYRPDLEAIIEEHQFQENVFLHGYHSTPWLIASQADCLLLPSRWEGMPNVVLEGLACGVPSIGMREAGGVSDIAKYTHNDDLIIVDTIEDMAKEMRAIKPEAKTTHGKSILPQEFSLSHVMKQFEKLLA